MHHSLSLTSAIRCATVLAVLASVTIGCGESAPYQLAPVKGIVTLDGQPVPHTQVVFMPKGTPENPTPGPGSTAMCDGAGVYELKTVRGEPGAVVGAHSVQIYAHGPLQSTSSDVTAPPAKESFPAKFNVNTELTFEVPADGTTAADFKLTTAP
jgi:hypothetical protein